MTTTQPPASPHPPEAQNLNLPGRYEQLARKAEEKGKGVKGIIRRVPEAEKRVEELLRQVREGGGGRFEFLLGRSGSGKTTFVESLPTFFSGVRIETIPGSVPLGEVAAYVEQRHVKGDVPPIYSLSDRDNLEPTDAEARHFFETLRGLFRRPGGNVLVLWPITREQTAKQLSGIAWDVGRDSVVDVTRGIFRFAGVPKSAFYEIADSTTQTLYEGRALETFGLTKDNTRGLIEESEAIGEFFARLGARSAEVNKRYGDILKARLVPRVWVMVAGDDAKELNNTVAALTYGTENRVDVARILGYLSKEDSANYLRDWKDRRESMAYIMQMLDVRVIELPPNVALAAVRSFGDPAARAPLNKQTERPAEAIRAITSARFFQFLVDAGELPAAARATEKETKEEYSRLERAGAQDKPLNRALAKGLQAALDAQQSGYRVVSERQNIPGSNLAPDVQVFRPDGTLVCLEPTWRGTKVGKSGQSTLTPGHIQQYVLGKVIEYVKDLNL